MIQQPYKVRLYKGNYCYNEIFKETMKEVVDLCNTINELCEIYEIYDVHIEIYRIATIQDFVKGNI